MQRVAYPNNGSCTHRMMLHKRYWISSFFTSNKTKSLGDWVHAEISRLGMESEAPGEEQLDARSPSSRRTSLFCHRVGRQAWASLDHYTKPLTHFLPKVPDQSTAVRQDHVSGKAHGNLCLVHRLLKVGSSTAGADIYPPAAYLLCQTIVCTALQKLEYKCNMVKMSLPPQPMRLGKITGRPYSDTKLLFPERLVPVNRRLNVFLRVDCELFALNMWKDLNIEIKFQ